MLKLIYCVYDITVGSHMDPFLAPNDDVARRMFEGACAQAGTPMNTHPQHFELYAIGEFDPASGVLVGAGTAKTLVHSGATIKAHSED